MTSPFAHSFQLSTEDLLAIVDYIQSPLDILELSLVSKRFAEITRTEWTRKRHLKLSRWDPDTILRHSQAEAPEGVWFKLARAACIRWQVLRPGYDRKPLGGRPGARQMWRLWKAVVRPKYIEKLFTVTSQIGQHPGLNFEGMGQYVIVSDFVTDSDSMFFEDTEAIGRFLTSSRSTLFNDAWLDHQRLVIASRYMYHGNCSFPLVSFCP